MLKGHGAIGATGASSAAPLAARKRPRADDEHSLAAAPQASPSLVPTAADAFERVACSGLLRTSHTTVTGVTTAFTREVRPNDILFLAGATREQDGRAVRFILSATSLALAEPFPADAVEPVKFTISRRAAVGAAGVDVGAAARAAAAARTLALERETGAGGARVQVKSADKGAYTYVAVGALGTAAAVEDSRESALDARARARGRDKFC